MSRSSNKKIEPAVEVILENQATLAEGPAWDEKCQALLWVDIVQHTINRLDPQTGKNQCISFINTVGSVVPRQSGGYVFTTNSGITELSKDLKIGKVLTPLQTSQEERINDGKCDAKGRYWTGTLAKDLHSPLGALYCIDKAHRVEQKFADAIISNGMGWNTTNTKMYHIDSKKSAIFQFDFDLETGQIKNRQTFVDLAHYKIGADGMTVDTEDCIWVAMWDSGEIHRYKPNGMLDFILAMPVARVTSCCFGGADLTELYITSSYDGLTNEQRQQQPLAGSLFRIKLGIKGMPTHAYAG